MAELKKRAVAGSFIFKFDGETSRPKVALFKRSGDVRTYRHKYAPISGSVEPSDTSPLDTAWREIQEETSLTPSSLRLYRQGKPYTFTDESIGREWTINPFAFVLKPSSIGGVGEAGIHLDWEHESYDWFDPADITDDDSFGGVPRLLDSLRRVWYEIDLGGDAARVLDDGLALLHDDHESGARQLATKALDVFVDVLQKLDHAGGEETWWRHVRSVGWHIWKNGREHMGAPILAVILESLAIIEDLNSRGAGAGASSLSTSKLTSEIWSKNYVHEISQAIRQYSQQRQRSSTKIGEAFTSFFKHQHLGKGRAIRIVTLSCSSTILSCITHALHSKHNLDIRILESRPLFEGVKMADKIIAFASANNISLSPSSSITSTSTSSPVLSISLLTDASAGIATKDADIVLLGADLIDKHGNVSNKTGSLPTVLAARHISPAVKVIVLAEREKIMPFEPPGHEENDADEVTVCWGDDTGVANVKSKSAAAGGGVEVRNVYFEWVDAALVDTYITEDGVLSKEGVTSWAADVKIKADHYFDGL